MSFFVYAFADTQWLARGLHSLLQHLVHHIAFGNLLDFLLNTSCIQLSMKSYCVRFLYISFIYTSLTIISSTPTLVQPSIISHFD